MKQKDNIYFDGFVTGMGFACEAAAFLKETAVQFVPAQLEMRILTMHEIEHAADIEKHRLMEKLAKEFITPIEREDIMLLAQQIDDVTDCIEDVARKMFMFNILTIRAEMVEFAEIIHQCCVVTKEAVAEMYHFRRSDTLRESIIRINELEETGDRLHCSAMRRLYTSDATPLERIQWTKMFDYLEDCCDKCEDVTDSIEMVMLKNS
ncbi:MAG: DUF47 family protein [Clostridia bacterium]